MGGNFIESNVGGSGSNVFIIGTPCVAFSGDAAVVVVVIVVGVGVLPSNCIMISFCLSSTALLATDRKADCALAICSSSAARSLACSSSCFFRSISAAAVALASFSFCSAWRARSWAAWIRFC